MSFSPPKRENDPPMHFEELISSPRHGFRGDRKLSQSSTVPASLTIAISREAGSRGNTIGTRAGQKLGWQVFNQEILEYISQEGPHRQNIIETMPPAAAEWVEKNLLKLQDRIRKDSPIWDLARLVLALGAQGEVLLIGRGAGAILPSESTLHVRMVAPLADRIAYMAQWLRMTEEEAAEQVRLRDARRSQFISDNFQRQPNDVGQYDLVLNSSYLGEELCADLIVQAAKAKQKAWKG